ncbi:F-box/LRR-repeat LRR-repeat 18 [Octopus vulgaris]|uniref:F-box/LRR-repeat LRR-repeat 18 n=1 Tax=Octopus vulgaris TaxID=6645 RepID=A0AA36FQ65_OCTVU|nr:F-box/LRR-repeat LRR-repeat 18 [Octopus vulgaris]
MAAPSLNLLQLPDALLLRIFTYLPIPDVYQLSKSSPKLHCLCYDQYVVSSLHLSCFHEMSKDIYKEIISNSCHHICKLNLNHCYWLPAQVVTEMVLKCQKVTDLHLIECKLRSHQLVQILAKNQLIRVFSCSIASITDITEQVMRNKAAQNTLWHLKKLCLHFKQETCKLDLSVSVNFVHNTSLFHYCGNLESLRVLGTPHRGLPKDMLSPLILNVNNFQRIKELAINDAADPAARIFFFGTLLELCKVDLHLKTLLKPMANLTTKPYFANIFKNMSEMENLDLSRSNIEVPMDMIKWEEAVNLRHLNLLENIKINSEQLSTLAGLCPHIISLNLQYCISSFQAGKNNYPLQEDLKGLQALISSCRHLTHLNLSGIHSHYLRHNETTICDALAELPGLKSLALSSCAVVHKHSDAREHTFNIKLDEVPAKKRRMSWMEPNSPFSELSSDVNLYSTDSLSSGATTNSSCQDLETLVKGCPNMEHFELITPNFYSVFHKVLGMCTREQNFYACEPSRQLHESQLMWIGHWRNLRYLQLTGIPEIRLGTSLVSICKHCIHLERLHLAQLGLPGHITYHSNLCKALTHCKQLKDFRIEQPNMKLNETFFRSLWSCPELERVCVASNRSTYDSVLIDQLLSMIQTKPPCLVDQPFPFTTH